MLKIKQNNLKQLGSKNMLTRICAFAGALIIPVCASSCGSLGETQEKETVRNEVTTDDFLTEDTLPFDLENGEDKVGIYDFPFLEQEEKKIPEHDVDWGQTDSTLRTLYSKYYGLMGSNCETNYKPSSNHCFEIAEFKEEDSFGGISLRIVDEFGNFHSFQKYNSLWSVNPDVTMLENSALYTDTNFNDYLLTNHVTGVTKSLRANSVNVAHGYIVLRTKFGDFDYRERLLYPDGSLAIDEHYDRIIRDALNKNICLTKDNETEILDTATGKARKIPMEVTGANNGYLVVSDGKGKNGIYYLENLESALVEKIPFEFSAISPLRYKEEPLFSCGAFGNMHLYSAEKGCLSSEYKMIYSDLYESGYFMINTMDDRVGLIDYNGNEILVREDAKWFDPIPLTDKVVYKSKSDDKYGVMDFEGNILLEPAFDTLHVDRINDEDGQLKDVFVVGHSDEQNVTVVFNKDLGQELVGNYDYFEAINKVMEKSTGKVYTK